MRQTFTTTMPDRVGAFLKASRSIAGAGANIMRVSYNKAVDMHILFIEVGGHAGPAFPRGAGAWGHGLPARRAAPGHGDPSGI